MSRLKWLIMGCLFPTLASAHAFAHVDPVSPVLFWVTSTYCMSLFGQYLAKKTSQPAVLGELLAGILFGNLFYYFQVPEVVILREGASIFQVLPGLISGNSLLQSLHEHVHNLKDVALIQHILNSPNGATFFNTAHVLDIFSRYGLIYLLFMVGLETSWTELKATGKSALAVASIGVIAPIVLGCLVFYFFYTDYSFQTIIFIAATLSATSVGITARVLKDMGKLGSRESKIILGAAMIDDVLGLFILAIVSSLVLQGQMNFFLILKIIFSALLFFGLSLYYGPWLIKRVVPLFNFLEVWEAKFVVAFVFVMFMAWMASLLQLSSIIGAFTAGLILHDELFSRQGHPITTQTKIKDLMAPFQFLLTPLFFFLMGVQVKLESFLNVEVLMLASVLSLVAIAGKLVSGYVVHSPINRLFIGVGMMPRGEVGLIFASMGQMLGVVSSQMFSAIIVMVVITTLIAPPWMRFCLKSRGIHE